MTPIEDQVQSALSWLREHSTRATLEGMARYGLPTDHALGVAIKDIQTLAKQLGRSHELALALWETRCYEARLLCSFVDEPAKVTAEQMDRWCDDFDNWGVCDTVCFHLFDRTPLAWAKVVEWSERNDEFGKRASFALLACLAGHDKKASDQRFLDHFELIELAATDERNYVKKGVSWALRRIGWRNAALNTAAVALARRLAESPNAAARWIGKDTLRDITKPALLRKLAAS